jgi:hypothetical protein
MLTEQQKVDVRRHCGFPVYGNGLSASPPSFGYRYYEQYLILEYRMNNLAPEEETTLLNNYLSVCNTLESAIPTASDNLDTDQAAVWYHNKNEVRDRFQLYKLWCIRLCDYLKVFGPAKLMQFGLQVMV